MNTAKHTIALILALLFTLGGCSQVRVGLGAGESTGSIAITLPNLDRHLASHRIPDPQTVDDSTSPAKSAARAIGYLDRFSVEVLEQGGAVVIPETTTTLSSGVVAVESLPPGFNYQIRVRVYNTSVSNSVPTVMGTATGVTIVAGQASNVNVTCFPTSVSSLATGASAVNPSLASYGEAWYSLAVTAGQWYTFDLGGASGVEGDLYDTNGAHVDWTVDKYSWKAVQTGTIYFALLETSGASNTTANLTVSNPSVLSEGTAGAPIALVERTWHQFLASTTGTTVSYYSYFNPDANGRYRLYTGQASTNPTSGLSYEIATSLVGTYVSVDNFVDFTLTNATTYKLALVSTFGSNQASWGRITPFLPADATEYPGSMNVAGGTRTYEADVVGGHTYTLNWADSFQGPASNPYTLDVKVSAYQSDLTTSYFTGIDSGYSSGSTIAVPLGQTKLYVRVAGYYSSDVGTFALKLTY